LLFWSIQGLYYTIFPSEKKEEIRQTIREQRPLITPTIGEKRRKKRTKKHKDKRIKTKDRVQRKNTEGENNSLRRKQKMKDRRIKTTGGKISTNIRGRKRFPLIASFLFCLRNDPLGVTPLVR